MKLLYERHNKLRLQYPTGVNFPLHLHSAVEMVIVQAGSLTVLYGNQKLKMQAGDVFISFPNRIHGYENTVNFQGYVLIIPTAPYLSGYQSLWDSCIPVCPVVTPPKAEWDTLRTLLEQFEAFRKLGPEPLQHGYLLVLLGRLLPFLSLKPIPKETDALQRVLRYISEHYTQPFSRSELAQSLGYSESYISHLFSEYLDTTLTGYVTLLRLNDAQNMLRHSDIPVAQIAMSLGFPSIRSFNRYFQKEMHMTPTDYRSRK